MRSSLVAAALWGLGTSTETSSAFLADRGAGTGSCANAPLWLDAIACRPDQPAVGAVKVLAEPSPPHWDGPSHCVDTYCVFASRKLGRGIGLVTTQENAEAVSRLLTGVGGCDGTADAPPFHVTAVPGKGLGLVANRTIKRGDRIMEWLPTMLVHRNLMQAVDRDDAFRQLEAAVMKLPAPRRRAFMRQAGQFGGHQISDILFTNSFQMDLGAGSGQHYGNFPEVSRFNHDCRPK